jgi:vitamin B12 transporter
MKRPYRYIVAMAAIVLSFSHSAHAERDPANAIIVTATRTAVTADETLAPVTVITREDIERSQAKSVAELLTGTAGVNSSVSGGYGKATSLFLRGTNADHVLVLVDGIRVGSATLGTMQWEYLPLAQVERIEIVRGPRSSLYGADAIGGVIQIFTRKGEPGFRAGATAGGGSDDAKEYTANISGAQGGFHYSASASHFRTDGINARTVAAANEPDDDGYYNKSGSARVGYRFSNTTELQAFVLHTEAQSEYDGSFVNETDTIQNVSGVEFSTAFSDNWNSKFQVGHGRDESENFLDRAFRSNFNTTRRTQSWQNDISLPAKQLVTLGVDHQTDLIDSSSTFVTTSRDNTGYFAQYQVDFGAASLLLGGRSDDNQAYGNHGTGNIALGVPLRGERLRLIAAYGTAFKAPSFNQLFFPSFGNPDLKPEESETFDLGLRGKRSGMTWSANAFQNNVDNLIVFLPPTFAPVNIGRARIRGLETEVVAKTGNNRLALNGTMLDPRDVESDKLLPRRAKRIMRIDESYQLGRWQVGATWLAQSYRYDDPQNTIRVGGSSVVDLYTRWDLAKHWFLQARAANVLNKEYQTAATFNSPGRNYFATLGYQYE